MTDITINLEEVEQMVQETRDNGCRGLSDTLPILFYCKRIQLNNKEITTEQYVQMMVEQKCVQDKPKEIKHWVNLINKSIKKNGQWR